MALCLSKFPLVCLDAIFKHVPLVDLFYSVGFVCSSWYKSRGIELIRRRRLRLVDSSYDDETLNYLRVHECSYGTELIERVRRDDGSPWHTLESADQLKFNRLFVPEGIQTVPFFSSLLNMSNVTRLNLILRCTTSDVTQVIRLIDHLSEHLVHLKLYVHFSIDFNFDEPDNEDTNARALRELSLNVTNLIECLNLLPSVRHLHLVLSNMSSHPPLLSCLSRLTTFAISAHGFRSSMDDWIYGSIKQYAQNVASIDIYNLAELREMLKFDARLASKFNVLDVYYDADEDFDENQEDMQAVSLFCTRFSSLTKLNLNVMSVPLPMTKLARCLSLLTQLVHLVLYFYNIPLVEQPEQVEEGEMEVEEQAQQEITQVPSVRLFETTFSIKSHLDTERLFIPEIFPNLQVLQLKDDFFEKCSDCEINPDYGEDGFGRVDETNPELGRRIAECKRLTLQPFRRCANLHTVALRNFSGKQTLINRDDL